MTQPPPYDPVAERRVLGVALDSAWNGPPPAITADDLYVPLHRQLWQAIDGLAKPIRPADIPTDLRPLARAAVKEWLPGDHDTGAAATVRRHAAARRALQAAEDIATAARHVDVDEAARIAHQLAEDLEENAAA